MNNTGTKYVRIMKQTTVWREKNGEYIPCTKNVNTGTKYVRIMKQTAVWREKKESIYQLYKMWIIQEPNTLEFWNKLHFEEKKNVKYISCLKYSVPILVEYIKCNV